jgi:hypothetical protein
MDEFRQDNTEGYNDQDLEKLNAEWRERAKNLNLEYGSEDYEFYLKAFSDEISRR